jgi:release factor glutamine methyltransferase
LPDALAAETIARALGRATTRLAHAGCDTPRLDAELLLATALGVTRSRLVLDTEAELLPREAERFEALLARRAGCEPVAYILGVKEFRRISLHVDRRVLIPRPETELLVEVGLGLEPGARVADVGTGSGAVALALKDERPDLEVLATDLSPDALAVATRNAAVLGLDVAFLEADLLDGISCDAALANLPYVPVGAPLPPDVARYEPPIALFAGPDGFDLIRRLIDTLPSDVRVVGLEIAPEHANAAATRLRRAGFDSIETLRDLAGHERVVVASRG